MFQTILQKSIEAMKNDNKIIRLTFVTSFFHSLIAILLIIININNLLAKNYENGLYLGKVSEYFIQEISKNGFVHTMIIITIILFVAYSLIYPL
jgi:hypothetical protein